MQKLMLVCLLVVVLMGAYFIHRMDPNSSFCLIIRLLGNPKKTRKEISSYCFQKIIDSDLTNYNDLVASIVEEYAPRYLEVPHLQYYDEVLNISRNKI
jgi:hypothetical protein